MGASLIVVMLVIDQLVGSIFHDAPTKSHLVGGFKQTSLEPWNFMTFHILGMSSSQLTIRPSFFKMVETTNQQFISHIVVPHR